MKTTNQTEASAPANVRPSSVSKHQANRGLSTDAVLNCLRTRLPRQYEIAEVVGKWVWLDISPTRKPGLASLLWALGFHWNQRRGVWLHPCGSFNPFGIHPADPRAKYHCYFPTDEMPVCPSYNGELAALDAAGDHRVHRVRQAVGVVAGGGSDSHGALRDFSKEFRSSKQEAPHSAEAENGFGR